MSKSKDKGNVGERHHRVILRPLWPNIEKFWDRYDPTRDHRETADWHVESKKRATWNIKDVVRSMETHVPKDTPWLICYEDANRLRKENPTTVVAILPLEQLVEVLQFAREGGYDV